MPISTQHGAERAMARRLRARFVCIGLLATGSRAQDDGMDLADLPEFSVETIQESATVKLEPSVLHSSLRQPEADLQLRFLLYAHSANSSLYEQYSRLEYYLRLAESLRRTLVLPRYRVSRSQLAAAPVAWSELFNMTVLNWAYSVIDLEAFAAEQGHVIQLLYADASQGCSTHEGQVVAFDGVDGFVAQRRICDDGQSIEGSLRAAQQATVAVSAGVLDSQALQEPPTRRPFFRFVDHVYDAAAEFVRHTFGDHPFVAVHWQRAPFEETERSRRGELINAHTLVRHVRRLTKRHGALRIFIVTDSVDRNELGQVRAKLRAESYAPPTQPQTALDESTAEHVQLAICGIAAYFLGTRGADFSRAALSERQAVFGHSPLSAMELTHDHTQTIELSLSPSWKLSQWSYSKDEL